MFLGKIVRIKEITPDELDITFECPKCGELVSIAVPREEYDNWYYGDMRVQDAFKSLGPDERELFITGWCPDCQEKAFGGDWDEDE